LSSGTPGSGPSSRPATHNPGMVDPVTDYAKAVVRGKIVAGLLVRQAAERHLRDLKEHRKRSLEYSESDAVRVIDFFSEVLVLPENTEADEEIDEDPDAALAPQPFHLQPWQQFIAGSCFGWYNVRGFRRFREAYLETAKGSGKTPLGAGIMLYMLVADGELGAQVFSAANTLAQAKDQGFRDAVRMVDASDGLSAIIEKTASNLAVMETGSFFRPISAEKRGLDGKRVHGALIDELHEHQTPVVNNKIRKGTKGRRNALIVKTTNSGFDRTSVCWNQHELARKILGGVVENDAFFAYICGMDPCPACRKAGKWFPDDDCRKCDRWDVEGPHWLKANPNLGVSLSWQYLRELVNQAKVTPSEVSDLLRFNFCIWTSARDRFVDMGQWQACTLALTDDDLLGMPCYGGLDLGQTDDFSSFALCWDLGDLVYYKAWYWIPRGAVLKYPDRPYDEWERESLVTVTEGNATDYDIVRADIETLCVKYGVTDVAYDPKLAEETARYLAGKGITMIPTGQGFQLSEALHKMSGGLVDQTFAHDGNRISGWMASNAVILHGQNNLIRLDKAGAPEKIDGMVAKALATDRLIRHSGTEAEDPEGSFG
jgi:phage terminase large subunit-like protein